MALTFREALQSRRSCYELNGTSPIGNAQIREILEFALLNVPSSFNCQSTRLVLFLGEFNKRLWEVIREALRNATAPDRLQDVMQKVDAFAAGCGTVLFYEDQAVIAELQIAFPSNREQFPVWSEHTSAMHQLTVWTMLEEAGLGASLQHYTTLIDPKVKYIWNIPAKWRLVAEMPFGGIGNKPAPKDKQPLSVSLRVFE